MLFYNWVLRWILLCLSIQFYHFSKQCWRRHLFLLFKVRHVKCFFAVEMGSKPVVPNVVHTAHRGAIWLLRGAIQEWVINWIFCISYGPRGLIYSIYNIVTYLCFSALYYVLKFYLLFFHITSIFFNNFLAISSSVLQMSFHYFIFLFHACHILWKLV